MWYVIPLTGGLLAGLFAAVGGAWTTAAAILLLGCVAACAWAVATGQWSAREVERAARGLRSRREAQLVSSPDRQRSGTA